VEFYANLPIPLDFDPLAWTREKEAQGWHGVCASDHLWLGRLSYPHVFSVLGAMAASTRTIRLTSSFANNLFRSPVEFAQASLTLHRLSQGRFDAGLGAGWLEDEMTKTGRVYPDGPTRVSMVREALTVVRQLLDTGTCQFEGEHYRVNFDEPPMLGAGDDRPPLVGAASGPRAIREITPLVDRMEIKANGRATRGGQLDMDVYRSITEEEFVAAIRRVRAVRSDIPLNTFLMVGAGEGAAVSGLRAMLGDCFLGRFVGDARQVAQAILDLEAHGIERVQLTPFAPGSLEALVPHLGLKARPSGG
jgi:alkanesulfonate monooxygenase SsuD/methylene tetrahydromethanopterin reductase-like flavin-dependent oxidoreductase (luciferase family)